MDKSCVNFDSNIFIPESSLLISQILPHAWISIHNSSLLGMSIYCGTAFVANTNYFCYRCDKKTNSGIHINVLNVLIVWDRLP